MSQTIIKNRIKQQHILNDVSLELTYQCNLKCFFCYNDLGKKGQTLTLEQYRTLLQDLSRMQTMYLMLTGGEPMIHPDFFEIGSIAKDLGFVIRIRTNGHSLSDRMAARVRDEVDPYIVEVSLHGGTAQSHDRQTLVPGSFDKLTRNISSGLKAGLRIGVVTTPTLWNQHEIDEMFDLCESLEVPLRFQGPVAPRDNGDREPLSIQPDPEVWKVIEKRKIRQRQLQDVKTHSRFSKMDETELDDFTPATCSVGVAGVDIDPYGNVQACIHLQESAGNLHDQSIEEIWYHSPLFQRARNRAVQAAKQFSDIPVKQFGAPVYCLAVEENANKPCNSAHCGRHEESNNATG